MRTGEESDQRSVLAPPEATAAFSPAAFFSALLKQLYLDQGYVPRSIYVPVDFPDRELLADALRERSGHKIEIAAPQRGEKRSLVDLVCTERQSRAMTSASGSYSRASSGDAGGVAGRVVAG
jgi:excinuclease UvrABC nuclease subunit